MDFDCEGVDGKESRSMSETMTTLFDLSHNRILESSKTRFYLIVTALREINSLLQIEMWMHLSLQ